MDKKIDKQIEKQIDNQIDKQIQVYNYRDRLNKKMNIKYQC